MHPSREAGRDSCLLPPAGRPGPGDPQEGPAGAAIPEAMASAPPSPGWLPPSVPVPLQIRAEPDGALRALGARTVGLMQWSLVACGQCARGTEVFTLVLLQEAAGGGGAGSVGPERGCGSEP